METAIVLYDGFDELDAIGPYEVFENAADSVDLSTSLRTLDGAGRVTASHGLRVEPDGRLDRADPDLVVVPGGGWNDRDAAGAWAEAEAGALPGALSRLHAGGVALAGVCTGGMLLARAGLLEGRPAVTHAGALSDLEAAGADVVDARVVDDGDILTAGGVTAGIDLALYLLAREFGPNLRDRVARRMEYEPRGPVRAP